MPKNQWNSKRRSAPGSPDPTSLSGTSRLAGPAIAKPSDAAGTGEEQYPHPLFLLGKVLNALLLDPVSYDLQVLDRLNHVMGVLDATLTPIQRAKVDQVLRDSRGATYRNIPTLAFEPSESIPLLAGRYLGAHLQGWELSRTYEWLLRKAATQHATWENDLASYLLFDGGWADVLISMGRRDVMARRDEVRTFFQRR